MGPNSTHFILTIHRFKTREMLRSHQQRPALVAFNKAAAEQDLLEKQILIKAAKGVSWILYLGKLGLVILLWEASRSNARQNLTANRVRCSCRIDLFIHNSCLGFMDAIFVQN
jgi:hypothetical protein